MWLILVQEVLQMKLIIFDGTPEEFSSAAPALRSGFGGPAEGAGPQTALPAIEAGEGRFVTSDEARKVLKRPGLSQPMRKVLVKLYHAGDQLVSSEDLHVTVGYNADQFRGMMGAFGRRIANTIGRNLWFFRKDWGGSTGRLRMGLPSDVRQAMDDLGIR
jgi:hypothetical protein